MGNGCFPKAAHLKPFNSAQGRFGGSAPMRSR